MLVEVLQVRFGPGVLSHIQSIKKLFKSFFSLLGKFLDSLFIGWVNLL
jgi:hypothetical protein